MVGSHSAKTAFRCIAGERVCGYFMVKLCILAHVAELAVGDRGDVPFRRNRYFLPQTRTKEYVF